MVELVWLIPALPLAGFLILLVAGSRLPEPVAGWIATALVAGSFLVSLVVLAGLVDEPENTFSQILFEWIPAGSFSVDVGFLLDPLSMVMILFVTGVSALIHLYSIGYMHGDERFNRFFLYLNLFVFSMLMLVLGDNLLLTFLGWEGVGACSYLLISFWFEDDANARAGKKAFITNRVGDWGFMVATFAVFFTFGTITYAEFLPEAEGLAQTTATFIALMLFVGAIGKSAQLPLFIWLPDAMAGPTPVSALIHAATMVTAGVYLLTRVNPVIAASADWVPTLIAWTGLLTALVAATIAVAQTDIKKVLAYSTVSQLGFMFLAIGSGAYIAAIFHMVTHAFFKALMFLGAGSVIHGMGGEQDMRRMGGLRNYLPVTFVTFMIGWLAIIGVPPLAGFWSKDEILEFAFGDQPVTAALGFVAALLTAFYMSRQVFLVFFGEARWGAHAAGALAPSAADEVGDAHDTEAVSAGEEHADTAAHAHAVDVTDPGFHPHESPWIMTAPLVVLSLATFLGGGINLPFTDQTERLAHWLEPVVEAGESTYHPSGMLIFVFGLISLAVAVLGVLAARAIYLERRLEPIEPELFAKGWFIDPAISAFMSGPGRRVFDAATWFDANVVDGAVNGVGTLVRGAGFQLRRAQTGYVRSYALGISLGALVLVAFLFARVVGS
jgi:NADH-quinone oxidoreductase subunit L